MRAVEQGQAAGAGPSVMCGVDTSDEKEKKKKKKQSECARIISVITF